MLSKGAFTTMQWQSLLKLWLSQNLFMNRFHCAPTDGASYKMWDRHFSKLMESSCILSDVLSLDQLRNHVFEDTQGKRDLPAGMLHQMQVKGNLLQEEGNLLQMESPFQILRNNSPNRQGIVVNARSGSSRLLRFCSVSGKVGDDYARNQVHGKAERASRVLQRHRKNNWWKNNSIYILHLSLCKNKRDYAKHR